MEIPFAAGQPTVELPAFLLIRGAPGSGKSTLLRRLRKQFPQGVCIEVDTVRAMVTADQWQPRDRTDALVAAAALARAYAAQGYAPVVVAECFDPDALEIFLEALDSQPTESRTADNPTSSGRFSLGGVGTSPTTPAGSSDRQDPASRDIAPNTGAHIAPNTGAHIAPTADTGSLLLVTLLADPAELVRRVNQRAGGFRDPEAIAAQAHRIAADDRNSPPDVRGSSSLSAPHAIRALRELRELRLSTEAMTPTAVEAEVLRQLSDSRAQVGLG
jgi:hypothetical protein